ncbi:MAG TPA: hypothetical protein VGE41_05835 [Verrucomicrobiae bacterium]
MAFVWSCIAPDRFYHCWDDAPIATFIPPFVHPQFYLGSPQDYYILAKPLVYLLWTGFLAGAIFMAYTPFLFILGCHWIARKEERAGNKRFAGR